MSRTYRKPRWSVNVFDSNTPRVHQFRVGASNRSTPRRMSGVIDEMGVKTPNRLLVQYRRHMRYCFDDFHQGCAEDRHNCLLAKNR